MVKYKDDNLDMAFSALADPTRRAILAKLAEGEAQVTELAEPFGMSLPAVSKHLKVLERAQLITRQVDGRVHRFHVNPEPLQQAKSWIEHYQKFWTEQLAALGDFLDSTKKEK
ncbi:MAG: metalloregulator ArsR/SmtB family transcription factor [Gammaproteobacteria bacterium]|nr:metalloregulator ArsR/SmtB family transcription factor [Gammaproteobacteria bacterium]